MPTFMHKAQFQLIKQRVLHRPATSCKLQKECLPLCLQRCKNQTNSNFSTVFVSHSDWGRGRGVGGWRERDRQRQRAIGERRSTPFIWRAFLDSQHSTCLVLNRASLEKTPRRWWWVDQDTHAGQAEARDGSGPDRGQLGGQGTLCLIDSFWVINIIKF